MSTKDDKTTDSLHPFYKRLTYEEKSAKNWEWIEKSCKILQDFNSNDVESRFREKLALNYDMVKGRGQKALNQYYMSVMQGISSEDTLPTLEQYKYYDIASPIFKRYVGEVQKRKLNAIAVDKSKYNVNVRKKKKLAMYQEHLKYTVVDPIQQEVTQSIFLKYNIQNPADLSPEEQEQIGSEIEQEISRRTPKDIEKFFRDEYKSPTETQIQNITDWAIHEFDLKFKYDECFKHLLASGREVMYSTIRDLKPHTELVNIMDFRYKANKHSFFIEDGDFWQYTKSVSVNSLINDLGVGDDVIKKMNELTNGYTGTDTLQRMKRGDMPEGVIKKVAEIDLRTDGAFLNSAPEDFGSAEGQDFLQNIMNIFGDSSSTGYDICHNHFAFASLDPIWEITRLDAKTGKLRRYYVGENYTPNPELDYTYDKKWYRAIYEADCIGESNNLFFNKRRCPFQNRSINNPKHVVGPYVGVEYLKMFDNSDPVAPLDFIKPYSYEYNQVKHKIEELDKTNIGRIGFIPDSYIPNEWKIEDFLSLAKGNKLVPIDTSESSGNPGLDAQVIKEMDLTNQDNIQSYINRLEFIRHEAELAMSYSPSQMGVAPASMTATNNQQNIIQGSYATEDVFSLHEIFIRNHLNAFVNLVRNSLRDNPEVKNFLLNDLGIAALDVDEKTLKFSDVDHRITNDSDEVENLKSIKNLLQPMTQNQLINFPELIKSQLASNTASLLNLAEEAEERRAKSQEDARKAIEDKEQKDRDLKLQMFRELQDREDARLRLIEETKRYGYEQDSWKFQRQADADADKIPDQVEVAEINAEAREKSDEVKKEIAEETLKAKKEIKKMELEQKSKESKS